jgi:hypothetical protein
MKLCNPKDTAVAVEIFIGPGEWFKTEVASKAEVDVPDELASYAKSAYGLVDVAPVKTEVASKVKKGE